MKLTILLCLFALGLFSCRKDHHIIIASSSNSGVVLPLSFDAVTPKVYITVGGQKVLVTFDTGSFGLRILAGALSTATLTHLHTPLQSGYGGADHGLIMQGEMVEAVFGMDTLKSKVPFPLC